MRPVLLWLALAGGQEPAPQAVQTREERVLALLQELAERKGSCWHRLTHYVSEPVQGGVGYRWERFVFCGNAYAGTFDDGEARRLGREVCRAYGLSIVRDHPVGSAGWGAVLDAFDPGKRVGFKLRGRGSSVQFSNGYPEHPDTDLTPEEARGLGERGDHIYSVDIGLFPRASGDEFTPTVGFLAGLVDFLNRQTEGEDVDLGAVLWEREAHWSLPPPAALDLPTGVECSGVASGWSLRFERPGSFSVRCSGPAAFEALPAKLLFEATAVRLEEGNWNREAPVLLMGSIQPIGDTPLPTLRVVQEGERPGTAWTHAARSEWLLLPGRFDLSRPFTLEFWFEAGSYAMGRYVRIGAAAGE